MKKEVLIIDKNQGSDGLARFLKDKGWSPVVGNVDAGLEKIKESENLQIALLNVESVEEEDLEEEDLEEEDLEEKVLKKWVERIKEEDPEVIVILIRAGSKIARGTRRLGASKAMSKHDDMESIYNELEERFRRLSIRNEGYLLPEIKIPRDKFPLIGESKPMFELNREIGRVANSKLSVLIEGATGTGKWPVAHLIHEESQRADKKFILVDCGILPNELLANELFGHKEGAYTGAQSNEIGKFKVADGGTLFLDEIGNMTPELQQKLLTVLQTGEVVRLGDTEVDTVDVRVICATNRNLREMVEQGDFREDLFYRLRASKISLPPLKNRKGDIPLLVAYFLQRIEEERIKKESEGNTKNKRQIYGVSKNVMTLFEKYDWPGNVRELESCLKNAADRSQGDVILQKDLSQPLKRFSAALGLDRSEPQMPSSETPEIPTYQNLLDLPVGVFCQMLADGKSDITGRQITGRQITEWWEKFSDDGLPRALKAKSKIDDWWLEYDKWLDFSKLSANIQAVIDKAVSALKDLQDEEGSELIADVEPISIKGKTLKGSLAEILYQIVAGYGGKKEKAAKELGISLENLESRVSYTVEDDGNDTSLSTSIQASRPIELSPSSVIDSLLIEPIKLFVLGPISHSEWRDKARDDQIGIIYLDLKVLLKRLGGEHDYIYFGGMTLSQIERNIYRRAAYLYRDHTEAAKALDVDPRTFNRYWPEEKEFPDDHTLD